MKNSLKAFSILAASSLVAFIPAILAQSAPPPPPPPPAPAAGNGAGPGASGGRRGAGGTGGGAGFAGNTDQPSPAELAAINTALKALLSQDAAAKAALAAHPTYNPIQAQGGGFNGAGRQGGAPGAGPAASGSGRRGGAGGTGGRRGGAGASGAAAGSGTA